MGFAIAHVRGGGEMGRTWYEDGSLLHKRNTFTDFVACARHLASAGWSAPDRLVAEGGSAGGLLMGAVANLAPEAFAGIVADVPFVDPLTSILDPSLPLTVVEWEEWGNPLEDPEVYALHEVLLAVRERRAQALPADPRRDLAARHPGALRRAGQVGGPAPGHRDLNGDDVLLKTEMSAGHGGVSGRYNAWRDRAFSYAWVLDRVGLA